MKRIFLITVTMLLTALTATATVWAFDGDPRAKHAPESVGRPAAMAGGEPAPGALLLNEGFEAGVVPPSEWTLSRTNANQTWKIMTNGPPYTGSYSADCEFDSALGAQDELLVSPPLSLDSATLDFWSMGSVYWCRDTNNNCDLRVWLIKGDWDGGAVDDVLIGTADASWTANWVWGQSTFDLTPLLTSWGPVRIGFQYVGTDGAQVGLDEIKVNGELMVLGTLDGHVHAADGAPVGGAAISIQGVPAATTDGAGYYFVPVRVGIWDVSASAAGYLDTTVTGVAINEGEMATRDITLVPIERLANGTFEAGLALPDGWTGRRLTSRDKRTGSFFHGGAWSFVMPGNGAAKVLYQDVPLAGPAGEAMNLSFWTKTRGVPASSVLRVTAIVTDSGGVKQRFRARVAKGTHDWRQGGGVITPTMDYTSVRVMLQFLGYGGKVWFDDLSLTQ
jgi:hypothetical protein